GLSLLWADLRPCDGVVCPPVLPQISGYHPLHRHLRGLSSTACDQSPEGSRTEKGVLSPMRLKKLPGTHTVSGEFSVSWSVSSPLSCFKKHSDALENTW